MPGNPSSPKYRERVRVRRLRSSHKEIVACQNNLIYNRIDMTTSSSVNISGLRNPNTIPMGLKVSVGRSLRPAVQRIVDGLNPEKIILFGSYAYGKPNPHSDVDLLV